MYAKKSHAIEKENQCEEGAERKQTLRPKITYRTKKGPRIHQTFKTKS